MSDFEKPWSNMLVWLVSPCTSLLVDQGLQLQSGVTGVTRGHLGRAMDGRTPHLHTQREKEKVSIYFQENTNRIKKSGKK